MGDNSWRVQLLPSSRLWVVNKIMINLKRRMPIHDLEGLIRIKEIATRLEASTFALATSRMDYFLKISLNMASVETNYGSNTMINSLLPNSASVNGNPSTAGNYMTNALLPNSASGNGSPSNAGAFTNMADNDWRAMLNTDSRSRIVDKIYDTVKSHLSISHPEGLTQLKEIATRFEGHVLSVATSQADYLRKISLKMLTITCRQSNNTVTNAVPSNSSTGNGYLSGAGDIPSPSVSEAKKRKLNQRALQQSVKKKLRVFEFSKFLERSQFHGDDLVCSVCLEGFIGKDKIRELCNCSHVFHRGCLDKWINRGHLNCPCCRSDL